MIRIFGTMTDPSGSPVPGAIIELRAISSTSEVLLGSTVTIKCDQQGAYSFQLAIGTYDAYAQNDRCGDMDYLGTARVSDNSVDGDLHSILVDGGINITPPMLDSALSAAQRAESAAALTAADRVSTGQNAESAKTDSAAAKTAKDEAVSAASTAVSARDNIVSDASDVRNLATQVVEQAADVSSKHSDVAAKAGQVSSQANIVSTKYSEVVAKAAQVSDDASATQSAKNISVAAADTATQKAALAATHDASAQDAAIRAENAASSMVGAVLDGGECDLSTGVYPPPITVVGKKYSTIWYVAVAGSVSGVSFDVGDILRYTTAKDGYYFRVDAKDDVYSVNGDKGAVVITPEKIGAEVAGAAQQLVDQHASKPGAHGISGVRGLTEALAGKEVAGAAASAITEHEAKSGAHSISGVTGLRDELDNIKTTGEGAIKDVADKLDGVQLKISQLEQYPKVINMSDIFDGTSVWSAPNGDFSVIEHEDYYHIQGIFRTISGSGAGGTLGNFKRNIKLSYAPCVVSENPSTVSTYPYIERGWTGGAYGKAINLVTAFKNSTWVMVNFIAIKEQQ